MSCRTVLALSCLMLSILVGGCATAPEKLSDDEQIRSMLSTWKQGVEAHDWDLVMTAYSDSFSHPDAGSKDEMRKAFVDAQEEGQLNEAQVNLDAVTVEIAGDTATVSGIKIHTSSEEIAVELTMAKEPDGWRIVRNDFLPA